MPSSDTPKVDVEYVKVCFRLPTTGDGWPPVSVEGVWATRLNDQIVKIANVPWFVRGVAFGDLYRVVADDTGTLWAEEKLKWSGNCTIRIVAFRAGPLNGDRQAVLDIFTAIGVTGEGAGQFNLVALDVPADADLAAVKQRLRDGSIDGSWEYEEGCIGDAWDAA